MSSSTQPTARFYAALPPSQERRCRTFTWKATRYGQVGNPVLRTHMATTSCTPVGNCPDSPEPILRRSPATGHDAEILDVDDPDLGYDAEPYPYQQTASPFSRLLSRDTQLLCTLFFLLWGVYDCSVGPTRVTTSAPSFACVGCRFSLHRTSHPSGSRLRGLLLRGEAHPAPGALRPST
jgi:hypothetical protein